VAATRLVNELAASLCGAKRYEDFIGACLAHARNAGALGWDLERDREINRAAWLLVQRGETDRALRSLEEALPIYERPADHRGRALVLEFSARIEVHAGRLEPSSRHSDEAAAAREAAGDRRGQAEDLLEAGFRLLDAGRFDDSRHRMTRALEIWKDLGDRGWIAGTVVNLGLVSEREGDLERPGTSTDRRWRWPARRAPKRGRPSRWGTSGTPSPS
jgi:tetratricopeptide (TPR) repeat protein